MKFAELTSTLSYAKRLQVGAIIVKNDQIIGSGYNGMPSGWDNNCEIALEDGTLKTRPEVLHSEMNALMKVAQSTESTKNAILFCTHAPCIDCAKAIYQAGITTVYYKEKYRDDSGLRFLTNGGIDVRQYNDWI
jgi:dCMP deaminase